MDFSREVIGKLDNGGCRGFVARAQLKYFQKKIGEKFETVRGGVGGGEGFKQFSCKEKERNTVIADR